MIGLILPLIVVVCIGVPTMLGILPAFLGVPAMLAVILIKDIIFIFLSRGLPIAMMTYRLLGGIVWGIFARGEVKASRFTPLMGTVQTKKAGSFNIMPQRLIKFDGVPMGIAPEKVSYNVGFDHIALIDELKKRGINDIQEIIDVNEYGQFENFKDDDKIKDLWDAPPEFLGLDARKTKEELEKLEAELQAPRKDQLDMSSMDDFYRYTTVASNPYHNEARIKLGIAQGVTGKPGSSPVLILAVAAIIIVGILAAVHILGGQNPAPVVVQGGSNVIPAIIPV
jgi:hypothetical protein